MIGFLACHYSCKDCDKDAPVGDCKSCMGSSSLEDFFATDGVTPLTIERDSIDDKCICPNDCSYGSIGIILKIFIKYI